MLSTISLFLVRRRDAAAHAWLATPEGRARDRARRRLAVWDTLLDAWTAHGTRWRTRPRG